jgi:tripartite-type tricarboxylate transporter receptor subunit TctC
VAFESLATYLPQIQSGALRALGVTTSTRSVLLPDVPTIGETVPGYEAMGWYGVGVPNGTSFEIIEKLNREINAGLANSTIKARLVEAATPPMPLTPAQFGAHVAAETKKWAKVIKLASIKAD